MAKDKKDEVWEGQKRLMLLAAAASLAGGAGISAIKNLLRPEDLINYPSDKGYLNIANSLQAESEKPQKAITSLDKFSFHKKADESESREVNLWDDYGTTLPLVLASGLAAGTLGYSGVDYLVNKYQDWRDEGKLEEALKEKERLLNLRRNLYKSGGLKESNEDFSELLAEDIEASYQAAYGNAPEDGEKRADIGWYTGAGLTIGGLLWYLTHKKVLEHYRANDTDAKRYKILKKRLANSSLIPKSVNTPVMLSERKNKEEDGKEDKLIDLNDFPKTSAALDTIVSNATTNMSQPQFNALTSHMSQISTEAAGKPETARAITQPIIDNSDAAIEGVEEAVEGKLKSIAPSFLQSGG